MRRMNAAVAVLAVLATAAAAPGAAATTLKGEIVDVQCNLKDAKNQGDEHADCALSCAKRGAAMGIRTEDGIYTITGEYTKENNKKLLEFVAKTVEVTGEVIEKDGKKVIDVTALTAAN